MIFGHEGQVRSGKSYEAVLYHILPAVAARRHVYVRLNGVAEKLDAIAAHLGMPLEEVQSLVHPMGNAEVDAWMVCDAANDGSMVFPNIEKNALVVVDECHEYWPVGRAALPDRVANFFAKHGHVSLDIVLISQDFKEVHRSVVRRMSKKNFYTKLDSLGKDNSYSVRFYSSPAAGKFELIGSEKRDYDPKVWALYHGVQPGIESNEPYKGNTRTLWQTVKKPAIFVAASLLLGVFLIARFFTGGAGIVPAEKKPAAQTGPVSKPVAVPPQAAQAVATVAKPKEPPPPVGVALLLELQERARPRYAGAIQERHIVEFREPGGQVIERLTSEQVLALGWTLEATPYGVILRAGKHEMIFTAWPTDLPGQQSVQTSERITRAGPPVMSVSESQPAPAAPVSGTSTSAQVASYGAFRG